MVANSAAPCFYVTQEQALKQYRRYKYGHSNIKNDVRRQMFAEIFVRFENLMKQANMYQYAAMDIVLNQPAPSFYFTDLSAIRFYYNAMEKKREKIKAR
jgi:hypothetical protein